ncbi:MAG: hypothetical protein AMJ54_06625 [Deltaproteobacteria bacterium SG8_13]|nr:MAG: hypothetical protein AMJ54_06625 [Deltaproteobacteria bacterium SG8_13]
MNEINALLIAASISGDNRMSGQIAMCTRYSNTPVLSAFCMMIVIYACSNTTLENYAAKDKEEEKIVALLIEYQDARRNFDLTKYLECLHDKGIYHHASSVMLSKQELSRALPKFWTQLQRGDRSFFPMCRENLSGNYFVRFRLINPTITIRQNTASVTAVYVNTGWRLTHYISMIKENNRWLINRLDWETG